jgi:hypothetical protein
MHYRLQMSELLAAAVAALEQWSTSDSVWSTRRLVNFLFECTQRGTQLLLRDIPVHNLLRFTCGCLTSWLDVIYHKDRNDGEEHTSENTR